MNDKMQNIVGEPLNYDRIVSIDTCNTRDLIPIFLDVLADVAPAGYEALVCQPFGPIPAYVQDDPDSDWYQSEEAQFLINDLFDMLNDHAAEGWYFGSSPSDGACYGFFQCDDLE